MTHTRVRSDSTTQAWDTTFWFEFEPVEVIKDASAEPGKQLLGKVVGYATVELPDKVNGDIIDLDTIRTEYLTTNGKFVVEHNGGIVSTVGYPTAAEVVPYTVDGVETRALKVEGYLYLNDDLGAAIYYKAKVMKDAGGARRLGWSLDGPGLVLTAEKDQPTRRVLFHEPKRIAICDEPANAFALWSVAASANKTPPDLTEVYEAARAYVTNVAKSVVNARCGDVDGDEGHIVTFLKAFPSLTWEQGAEAIHKIRTAVRQVLSARNG